MKIVTFGEIMLRLAPPGFQRFTQARSFEAVYGGGEANVAVSLANFGEEVEFVTRLPKNELGDACLMSLRGYGIRTEHIAPRRRPDRDLLPRDRRGAARQQSDLRPRQFQFRHHSTGHDRLEDVFSKAQTGSTGRGSRPRSRKARRRSAAKRSRLRVKWA